MLQCAALLDIDYSPIQYCAEGTQGDELLAAMGNRTLYFTPQITFVPTVAINGVSTFVTHQLIPQCSDQKLLISVHN
jgi:hypothetical protein